MLYNNIKFSGLFMVLPMLFCVGNAFGEVDNSLHPYYNVDSAVLDYSNVYNKSGAFNGCVGKGVTTSSVCGPATSLMVFIAQNITKTGAEFCMNRVLENKARWIVYFLPKDNKSKCFWLCQPGYGGADCSESANGNICYPEKISKTAFNEYETNQSEDTAYTENQDWLIIRHSFPAINASAEGEVFIAITDWVPSGHGAFVSPVMAQGENFDSDDITKRTIRIEKIGKDKLLCAPGYKPNAGNTDCEPINSTTCTFAGMKFCSGFEKDKYNESVHSLKADSSGCYRYFCKNSTQAFPSVLDKSCKDCAKPGRGGPSMTDGSCVVCPAGKYFDQKLNDCRDASAYSKSNMQFGRNNSTKEKPIVNQCWSITEPSAYKKCVLSGGTSGGNSGNSGSGGGNSGNSGSGGGTGSIGKYFQNPRIPDVWQNKVYNETVSAQESKSQYLDSKNTGIENTKEYGDFENIK